MLFMLGALTIDTRPFSANKVSHSAGADWAEKPVMNALPPSEFTGEGADTLTISGQLLPYKLGGLTQLDAAHQLRKKGTVVPVMRGDGERLGNYAITSITEDHTHLQAEGVGFVVMYSISLKKMPGSTNGQQHTVESLLNLFDGLG